MSPDQKLSDALHEVACASDYYPLAVADLREERPLPFIVGIAGSRPKGVVAKFAEIVSLKQL
jgi:hypothetical protein